MIALSKAVTKRNRNETTFDSTLGNSFCTVRRSTGSPSPTTARCPERILHWRREDAGSRRRERPEFHINWTLHSGNQTRSAHCGLNRRKVLWVVLVNIQLGLWRRKRPVFHFLLEVRQVIYVQLKMAIMGSDLKCLLGNNAREELCQLPTS